MWQRRTLTKDRLGSVVAITDETGAVKEKLEYDVWGKRRSADDHASRSDAIDGKTDDEGFTGHEMLDQLDLVHMNGRVYDPLTARFVSADALVQDPADGQSYNRYSYVMNNPVNFIDPTGFAAGDPGNTESPIQREVIRGERESGSGVGSISLTVTRVFNDFTFEKDGSFREGTVYVTGVRERTSASVMVRTTGNSGGGQLKSAAADAWQARYTADMAVLDDARRRMWQGIERFAKERGAETGNPLYGLLEKTAVVANSETFQQVAGLLLSLKGVKSGVSRNAQAANSLAAQNIGRIDAVIAETLAGKGNLMSQHTLKANELLAAGMKFLGPGYREIGKPGSGVFRSADGVRQFRIDGNSLSGNHSPGVPHGHLEIYAPDGVKPLINNHIPFGN